MAQKLVYTISEVGELLSNSRSTVYTMIREGELKAVKIRGGIRILKSSLDEYLDSCVINKAA